MIIAHNFQESETGLYVCLNTFLGFGKKHVERYFKKTGNGVFLHIRRIRKEVSNLLKSSDYKRLQQLNSLQHLIHLLDFLDFICNLSKPQKWQGELWKTVNLYNFHIKMKLQYYRLFQENDIDIIYGFYMPALTFVGS